MKLAKKSTSKLVLDEVGQKQYLMSKIKQPVTNKYPEGGKSENGILIDRYAMKLSENPNPESIPIVYWMLMDLIEFQDQKEHQIRMTYYRYNLSIPRWIYAGQTSFSFPRSEIIKYFTNAIKENKNFREVFQTIFENCRIELEK